MAFSLRGKGTGRDEVYFSFKKVYSLFSYHLPLRVLLLPEGGEAMQKAYEASVYYLIIY
ncbi:hypothetical protein BACCAC_01604 [Bacteroides caccae ATCC 43185]|jgi:hypothetical protein|nr:hypothetical protein BACCAC_01604 [Bacteroides caccae ATCC 43185]